MEHNIRKPTSVLIEDGRKAIMGTLNSLKLHPTLLEMILKEAYLEVQAVANETYIQEKARYEEALKRLEESPEENTEESEV